MAKELAQSERGQKLYEEQLLDQRSKLDRLFSKLKSIECSSKAF